MVDSSREFGGGGNFLFSLCPVVPQRVKSKTAEQMMKLGGFRDEGNEVRETG